MAAAENRPSQRRMNKMQAIRNNNFLYATIHWQVNAVPAANQVNRKGNEGF